MHCVVRAVKGIKSAYDNVHTGPHSAGIRAPDTGGQSHTASFPLRGVLRASEDPSGRDPPPSGEYFLGSTAGALFGNYEV